MAKLRPRGSRTGNHDAKNYSVGYGKPPQKSQFRPGQSGNPAGRRKGVRNFATDVKRTLKVPVKLNEGGRARKISTQEGVLMRLREKALKGDARALDRFLQLATRFNDEPGPEVAQRLSGDDQAILAAYAQEIAALATTAGHSHPSIKPRPVTRKREARIQ